MSRRKTANVRGASRRTKKPTRTAALNAGRRSGTAAWACPSALTLREVAAAHRALLRMLPMPTPVRIDCSALACVDTAGAQLLAAFVRERRQAGREAHLDGARATLLEAARLLGLTELEPA